MWTGFSVLWYYREWKTLQTTDRLPFLSQTLSIVMYIQLLTEWSIFYVDVPQLVWKPNVHFLILSSPPLVNVRRTSEAINLVQNVYHIYIYIYRCATWINNTIFTIFNTFDKGYIHKYHGSPQASCSSTCTYFIILCHSRLNVLNSISRHNIMKQYLLARFLGPL
jgi:hypothetical protein